MRGIFPRLLLSFSLTFLVAGLLSGLVVFSFSRRSVESFRHNFLQQIHANIARSVMLMGQAAYMMRQYQGDKAFADYTKEIESSLRTRLYLSIDGRILPEAPASDPSIAQLASKAGTDNQAIVEEDGGKLIVVQRLTTPDRHSYVVIGLHQLGPPPGMNGLPPPPESLGAGLPPPPPGMNGPPPPNRERIFTFFYRTLSLRFLVFLPIAGIICYLLARSFSAPLDRLRRISRQIAEGDLAARVGVSLGRPGNEIGDLGRDFDLMAERMESLINGQKRLLLDISHELRSPLARLNLALELAKKRSPEDDGNLARIARESERLNILIGQLLTLTRNQTLALDSEESPILLADLVLEVAADVDFENQKRGKGVTILALEAVEVAGSRELLRQAIENIVRNGAYYTRPGSQVEVCLFLRTHDSGKCLAVIRVRDYGPGVAEDKLPHLTEPFYRVAEARERNSGGAGLGLAIAHQAVLQHGGTLLFANAPDRDGLVVDMELPVREKLTAPIENTPGHSSDQGTTFS